MGAPAGTPLPAARPTPGPPATPANGTRAIPVCKEGNESEKKAAADIKHWVGNVPTDSWTQGGLYSISSPGPTSEPGPKSSGHAEHITAVPLEQNLECCFNTGDTDQEAGGEVLTKGSGSGGS